MVPWLKDDNANQRPNIKSLEVLTRSSTFVDCQNIINSICPNVVMTVRKKNEHIITDSPDRWSNTSWILIKNYHTFFLTSLKKSYRIKKMPWLILSIESNYKQTSLNDLMILIPQKKVHASSDDDITPTTSAEGDPIMVVTMIGH